MGSEGVDSHVLHVRLLVENQGARGSFLPGQPRLPVAGDAPDLLAGDHHFRHGAMGYFNGRLAVGGKTRTIGLGVVVCRAIAFLQR